MKEVNKLPNFPDLKSEKELDTIRGKMLVAHATQEELHDFLRYVSVLESLLDAEELVDAFGTEGWKHHVGLE